MDNNSMRTSGEEVTASVRDQSTSESIPQRSADRITFLAAQSLGVSMALLYVKVGTTLAFRSHATGRDISGTLEGTITLAHALSLQCLGSRAPMAIDQIGSDTRFGVLITEGESDWAYLGIPLMTHIGKCVGVLCCIDLKPHHWRDEDSRVLGTLTALLMEELALRNALTQATAAGLESPSPDALPLRLLAQAAVETDGHRLSGHVVEKVLHRSQKLEVIGELTAELIHDFRNILGVVSGSLSVLARTVTEPLHQDFVVRAERAVDRATRVIRQVLNFAHAQEQTIRKIDLPAFFEGARELIQPAVGRKIKVTIQSKCSWHVLADPHQLEMALLNLAINARDAITDAGELDITVREVPQDSPEIRNYPKRDYVAISVRDTGMGMSPEIITHAHEAFFTTKPPEKGTGLGLSMAHRFAQQSGGALRLESQINKGTIVTFYLPRATLNQLPLTENTLPRPDASLHGRATILVIGQVADSEATHYLRELGYLVVDADDGLHALALCEAAQAFDLVVIDSSSTGVVGAQVTKQLRVSNPALPVIVIAADSRGEFEAKELLYRPFTQDQIGAAIVRLLQPNQPGRALDKRIKHPAIRALYDAWHRNHSEIALPPIEALGIERLHETQNIFVCQLEDTAPFAINYLQVGAALILHNGGPLNESIAAMKNDETFAGLESAYQRCIQNREPTYEYLRFRLDSGEPSTFERLLLPCQDSKNSRALIVGMVILENLTPSVLKDII